MMQSQFMMIDPNELTVEWTVNQEHVKDLADQLTASGVMLSEVLVWLQDMRIIDGFHRVEAAKRLGWKEVPCKVWDCTEVEFWDARIVSAKKHQSVEDVRLTEWMFESWKNSEWFTDGEVDLTKFNPYAGLSHRGRTLTPSAGAMIKVIWENIEKNRNTYAGADKTSLDVHGKKFYDWIEQKAFVWGVPVKEVINKLMSWANPRYEFFGVGAIDHLARQHDLTFEQRQLAGGLSHWDTRKVEQEILDGWIEEEIKKKPPIEVMSLRSYEDRYFEEKRKEAIEQSHIENERYQQWAKSPAGQAEIARNKEQRFIESLKDATEHALRTIENPFDSYFDDEAPHNEGLLLLAQHLNAVKLFITDMYPNSEVKSKNNPIWQENISLRKQVAEQAQRIASLERALDGKVDQKALKKAMAYSSVVIEAMDN